MKKAAAAALTALAIGAVAGGLLLSRSGKNGRPGGTASPGQPAAAANAGGAGASSGESKISSLLLERTPSARLQLVSLYTAWSRDPDRAHDRRTLIHQVVAREEPLTAIGILAMAVAGDATPLEGDEMVAEAARAIAPLWKDDALFARGRDLLRLADNDKARALYAAALTDRAARPATGLAAIGDRERQELASDLIQVNMHSRNGALRAQTLKNVDSIAGPEVAEVLADPANAHNSRAARRAEQASREAAAAHLAR